MAHPGGRPLKFKTVKEMQEKIDAYFKEAVVGEYTITGLALALDTTRVTLIDYAERGEFSYTVKKAKARIENDYEIALRKHGRSGEIFGLKNFGWTDKIDVNNTGTITHKPEGLSRSLDLLREYQVGIRETGLDEDSLPN